MDGIALLCNRNNMFFAKWGTWKLNGNQEVEAFFGFPVTQDYACLIRICETLLLRMNLRQYHTKRRLSAIFNRSNDEMKAEINFIYLFMENYGQIAAEYRDIAILLLDTLESWIRGSRFILQKEKHWT